MAVVHKLIKGIDKKTRGAVVAFLIRERVHIYSVFYNACFLLKF